MIKRSLFITACLTALFAITNLLGWLVSFNGATTLPGALAAMNPMTAIGFLLLSIIVSSFLYLESKRAYIATIYWVALLLLVGIAGLQALHYLGVFPAIDTILFAEQINNAAVPARMSLITTCAFLVMTFAMFAYSDTTLRKYHFVEAALVTVLLVSLMGIARYFAPSIAHVGYVFFYSLSLQTSLIFLLNASVLLVFILSSKSEDVSLLRSILPTCVLLLSLVAAVIVWALTITILDQAATTDFSKRSSEIRSAITTRLNVYTTVLKGGRGLFDASTDVNRQEWNKYVSALDLELFFPGLQGVGYAKVISKDEIPDLEASIQNEGFPEFRVFPESDEDMLTSIIFLEPFDVRNARAFGFDMYSEPTRRFAMQRARDFNEPAMTSKVTLLQELETDVQAGFLIYIPVYSTADAPENLEQRKDALIGYVYSPFRMKDFIEDSVITEPAKSLGLRVYDSTSPTIETLMYESENMQSVDLNGYRAIIKTEQLQFGGHVWTLEYISLPAEDKSVANQFISYGALVLGLFISVLLYIVLYRLVNTQEKIQQYAAAVTKDLEKSKAILEEQNKDIKQKVEDLEKVNSVMVGRELKMAELKKEIETLKRNNR